MEEEATKKKAEEEKEEEEEEEEQEPVPGVNDGSGVLRLPNDRRIKMGGKQSVAVKEGDRTRAGGYGSSIIIQVDRHEHCALVERKQSEKRDDVYILESLKEGRTTNGKKKSKR